jgi:hypothetical protein
MLVTPQDTLRRYILISCSADTHILGTLGTFQSPTSCIQFFLLCFYTAFGIAFLLEPHKPVNVPNIFPDIVSIGYG